MLDSSISTQRSNGIDTVRAILALWILFAHVISWVPFAQGSSGVHPVIAWIMETFAAIFQPCGETHPAVIGFIVVSGYCIHRNGLRRTGGDITGYCIRRAFRILPVYFLATLFGIACFSISVSASPDITKTLSGTSALNLQYIALKLVSLSAFVPRLHTLTFQANAPLHTVLVEMWLYLLYPIVIVCIARRYPERTLWLLLLTVWVFGIALITAFPNLSSWWHNGSIIGFIAYWWIGAKCVDSDFAERALTFRYVLIAAWLALTLLIFFHIARFPLLAELRKAIFALLVGLAINRCDTRGIAATYGLHKIGKAGYSMYAFHAPLTYTLLIYGLPWQLTAACAILLGMAFFKIYEEPLTAMGKRLASSRRIQAAERCEKTGFP
jgi:peptidoglycan/LPS O-acetylase OafA/YrhL